MAKCPNLPDIAIHSPQDSTDRNEGNYYLNPLHETIEIICKVSSTPYPLKSFIYYTTNGSTPSGSHGIGGSETKTIELTPLLQKDSSAGEGKNNLWYRGKFQ